jgi:hypothetical protein
MQGKNEEVPLEAERRVVVPPLLAKERVRVR